jgi:hypothetical protein
MKPHAQESIPVAAYNRRMNALSAQPRPDKQSSRGTIFWSPVLRSWIIARRGGAGVVLEFYRDCPCGT